MQVIQNKPKSAAEMGERNMDQNIIMILAVRKALQRDSSSKKKEIENVNALFLVQKKRPKLYMKLERQEQKGLRMIYVFWIFRSFIIMGGLCLEYFQNHNYSKQKTLAETNMDHTNPFTKKRQNAWHERLEKETKKKHLKKKVPKLVLSQFHKWTRFWKSSKI